jgi:antitoxin ParD1/3/4
MGTMNVSLPDAMKDFIDEQVASKGYGSSSEYIRDLVRREQDREHLRQLLLEGLSGPVVGVADKAYFDGLRGRIKDRAAKDKVSGGKSTGAAKSSPGTRPAAKGGSTSGRKKN